MTTNRAVYARKVAAGRAEVWKANRPPLSWLDIELTERCNNSCIHCGVNRPGGDRRAQARELKTEELKTLLREAASLGCLTVRFTGGEPLLRDDFEDLYLAARHIGLRVMLFTNASLLTPGLIDLFGRVPPLETMEISVYGLTRETCRVVTRNAAYYDAVQAAVGRLAQSRIPFVVKGTLLPPAVKERGEFESWAAKVTGRNLKPSFVMTLDLTSRRNAEKNKLIRGLRMSARQYVEFSMAADGECLDGWKRFVVKFAGAPGPRIFTCFPGRRRGSVDAYGAFYYCLSLRHPQTRYDLKKGSLEEALLEFLPRLGAMTASRPGYLERCARCFLKALCQQCPAKSWTEHGTLDTPVDYFCEITHAQAVATGILGEGEKSWTIGDWPARVRRLADALGPETAPPEACPRECEGE